MSIKNTLKEIIKTSLKDIYQIDKEQIVIEIPKNKQNGDYSTNISLVLRKILNKDSLDIANIIVSNINTNNIIEKIEVSPPGFINFYIKKEYLLENINTILEKKKHYGKNNLGNNQKINIEFVSANPTGILHIGHGRGAAYGDNLARIMSFCGYDVTKEYYINDAGNQMNNLGISIKERYKELCGVYSSIPENGYHGKEIITLAENIYKSYHDNKLNEDVEFFKKEGLNTLLAQIKKDLDTFRVNFDVFTSEQSLYDSYLVDEVLTKLRYTNYCYIKDDALWLKTTEFGDEKDRVLIKSDGSYTYLMPDIAYHIDKINRGYDKLIDVLGADHHGYINRLKASLSILNKDPNILDIKILQMVRLIKDNEEIKLSKRTGKTISLMELIDTIGINATRYFFASVGIDTSMDFDIDIASKESSANPIYYIEYANARICTILKKYRNSIKKVDKYTTLKSDITYTILNKLCEFEDVVTAACKQSKPHLIATYVYELASLFHSFYEKENIITENEIYTNERLNLLLAIKIVINNSLDLIGIIPREEM